MPATDPASPVEQLRRRNPASSPSALEGLAELFAFDGSFDDFISLLLTCQLQGIPASRAACYRLDDAAGLTLVASRAAPGEEVGHDPWLAAAQGTIEANITPWTPLTRLVAVPEGKALPKRSAQLAILPIARTDGTRLVLAFLIHFSTPAELSIRRQRLELARAGLLLYDLRRKLQEDGERSALLHAAFEVLVAMGQADRFRSVAMAFCSTLAAQWHCARVFLGFLQGRRCRVEAMNHVEQLDRRMGMVQTAEAALEECLDQDRELALPPLDKGPAICRSQERLGAELQAAAVLTLPVRWGGTLRGAVSLVRAEGAPFTATDVESLRLTCELAGPRLLDLHDGDRWFGARLVRDLRRVAERFVKPERTGLKLAGVAAFLALAFLVVAEGTYRVDASFALRTEKQFTLAAPYDGFIASVHARPGDSVPEEGALLGALDAEALVLERARQAAEWARYRTESTAALRDGKTAEARIATAQATAAAAELKLLDYRIAHAQLRSPTVGVVVSADRSRDLGKPVKRGESLFEIAPLEHLVAELYVPEDEIAEVVAGQTGELAAVGYPERKLPFAVARITPLAEVRKQRNVFRVEAVLQQHPPWLRPGMEGVAKIDVGRRRLAWIWARSLINWVRMKLWL